MFTTIATYLHGLVISIGFLIFVVFSLPIFLYRYILENVVVPLFFSKTMGQSVANSSTMFATEFVSPRKPPRCCIVSSFVIEGHVPFSEVQEEILQKWISREGSKTFPEFQQYIDTWMGFLFWHKDVNFNLANHVYQHQLPLDKGTDYSEKWVCQKIEELLNKPFPPNRSPWEVHVIENYVNGDLSKKKMTTFVMRFHHGLADGFSILYAVIEGLFGMSLEKLSLATASKASLSSASPRTLGDAPGENGAVAALKYASRVLYDVGDFGSLVLRQKTPWHVPDNKKSWKQLYARSRLIPIEKLKQIKNKFGVSFTGVIFACITAGVSKSLHRSNPANKTGKQPRRNFVDNMPTMAVLPLPGHPKKLTNHAACALFDLPTGPHLDPVGRLRICEQGLAVAKQSTLPFFSVLSVRLVGYHLAFVAKFMLANRAVPMGLSNFPGPGKEIEWNGRKGLSTDFIAGALNGVAGAGFMVLSYRNHIRIAATVENAIMEKQQLETLISDISQEIDSLLEMV